MGIPEVLRRLLEWILVICGVDGFGLVWGFPVRGLGCVGVWGVRILGFAGCW